MVSTLTAHQEPTPDRTLVAAAAAAPRLLPRPDDAPPPRRWHRVVTAGRVS
jgi:hypothetical protein